VIIKHHISNIKIPLYARDTKIYHQHAARMAKRCSNTLKRF
jgi:hypothetical protein